MEMKKFKEKDRLACQRCKKRVNKVDLFFISLNTYYCSDCIEEKMNNARSRKYLPKHVIEKYYQVKGEQQWNS